MRNVLFSNGYQLSIIKDVWECGDGCCSETTYDYQFSDHTGRIVKHLTDSHVQPDDMVDEFVEDYELIIQS